jgi:hypothetical protein
MPQIGTPEKFKIFVDTSIASANVWPLGQRGTRCSVISPGNSRHWLFGEGEEIMRKSYFLFAVAYMAPALALADNGPFGSLSSILSSGSLGNFSKYTGAGYIDEFDTDNGNVYGSASGGTLIATLPFTTITQYAGGPTLNVFNFANFDDPAGANFTIVGANPAVIATTGNISIAGHIQVNTGGGAGGAGGFTSAMPGANGASGGNNYTGGSGGIGPGATYIGGGEYGGGAGGGGAGISVGQSGTNGTPQTENVSTPPLGYENPGGPGGNPQSASLIEGGGGGGGGAGGNVPGEQTSGANGGAGGGAIFFITPGNFTLNSNATLTANGAAGGVPNESGGSSGGGGGGDLWFDIGQTFDNEGLITALGGAGGNPHNTGVNAGLDVGGGGSGGELIIDPTTIINNGTLNVSDGLGGNTYGGNIELLAGTIENSGSIIGEVPEPSTLLVLIPSLTGLLAMRRRKV